MRVEKDFEELLKLLKENGVNFCIIGSFAVGFYSRSRYTKDMDILVEPTSENGKKIIRALKKFGFSDMKLTAEMFKDKDAIIQVGYEPVRVDFLTSIEDADFKRIWKNKVKGKYGDAEVFFIGLDELIKSKEKTDREIDKADVEILLKAKKMRGKK